MAAQLFFKQFLLFGSKSLLKNNFKKFCRKNKILKGFNKEKVATPPFEMYLKNQLFPRVSFFKLSIGSKIEYFYSSWTLLDLSS